MAQHDGHLRAWLRCEAKYTHLVDAEVVVACGMKNAWLSDLRFALVRAFEGVVRTTTLLEVPRAGHYPLVGRLVGSILV